LATYYKGERLWHLPGEASLFVSYDQGDDGPSKKDNQKNNKFFDQFGVHKLSFFSKAGDDLYFFLK
jgi:hypothetical protein